MDSFALGNRIDPPAGAFIPRQSAEAGKYEVTFIFRNIWRENVATTEISAGRYACWLHDGGLTSQKKAFLQFLAQAQAGGARLASDVYIFDQINYARARANHGYLAKYTAIFEGSLSDICP